MKHYAVNDTWLSLQGEGARAGSANVFVRFAGCNLTCRQESIGFDCDTEFVSHRKMTASQILDRVNALWPSGANSGPAVILTGGEPLLQVDREFLEVLANDGVYIALETNGSMTLPDGDGPRLIDWVCVSPKVAEHAIRCERADELKYVRNVGQGIPKPAIKAAHHRWLSPAAKGESIDRAALNHCIELCLANPEWKLTMQAHKLWQVR